MRRQFPYRSNSFRNIYTMFLSDDVTSDFTHILVHKVKKIWYQSSYSHKWAQSPIVQKDFLVLSLQLQLTKIYVQSTCSVHFNQCLIVLVLYYCKFDLWHKWILAFYSDPGSETLGPKTWSHFWNFPSEDPLTQCTLFL